jgi:acyl carrier protein
MIQQTLIIQLRDELRAIKPKLPSDMGADDNFRNTWNLDSLELVEFVARLEQQFGIMIPDEDLAQFYSLNAAANYLNAKVPSS